MTYDKTNETSSPEGNSEHRHGPFGDRWSHHAGARSAWSGPSWANRPGFHPMKAVIVLGGFAIFPPLGVLALGYFLWNSRSSFSHSGEQFAGNRGMGRGCGRGYARRGPFTGNAAYCTGWKCGNQYL